MTHGLTCSRVELHAWDAHSDDHIERLRLQRLACGWGEASLPRWQRWTDEGRMLMFWVSLPRDDPHRQNVEARQLAAYPQQASTLTDPDGVSFLPIGHVALYLIDEDEDMSLHDPAGGRVVKIAALYISTAVQGQRLGSSAMDAIEARAATSPLSCSVVLLDTLPDAVIAAERAKDGKPMAAVSNEQWYIRRGYKFYGYRNRQTSENPPRLLEFVLMKKHLK
ncbi:uncharacterized protein L969DRAFT_51749 [Mixia osmundae IAM 14324]|uniref:N-acetyltransferase domain-containing protein n=1 Tax=Mixia osmundae (strain CBS 9802 / IAM 14324 / JCM 22182 / KY 12970) TaxID=764103 RepID=G7DWS9_MIXOS|nr:uncharacterized protein L969DRAFT_97542 [Mixia osmundae IAM 14324]XP_014566726.1 uncharacterized protein L969DRAFT_51749 [Mixia osmundae IAM 14324]KEI36196.1 hypothetical protein L969DRAFT_97542 [Mixia osmundae IAM 14324]KEI38164.1 hypothetical protein L969DRAFT_51749 [Mixia osmundae IAM 14324]GAA95026.1 hypothetical protein E5Q_01681 [Mixia osmundae IAM 14324]